MVHELNFMVGGEAGQGVQSVGFLLAKAFARGGYHVFADQDYESRVRGGHNFFRVRVKESQVMAIVEPVDVLIALNKESIDLHRQEVTKDGVIVFDAETIKDISTEGNLFGVPLASIAVERGGNRVMANTVALAAAFGLVGYDLGIVEKVLRDHFGAGEVGEGNIRAARAGYDYAQSNFKSSFNQRISPLCDSKRMLLNGNEAIALGAIAAGCKFMAAYPMTPSTTIMEYLEAKAREFDLVVVQPEDEIAAVNMIVGAGYVGVRAMTATSGSGFCLMVEGLGLAGMTETPIVIIDGQRPGPAVGLPTRTEQGDLQFALHAHQGDFPRAVLAPANVEDGFWLTIKAFNLAEKYQLPVIILTDHYFASSYTTVERFDISRVTIDRGILFSGGSGEYLRYKITDSGISPRAFPGQESTLVAADADEHNEAGHIIEDAETRTKMTQKRLRKLFGLKQHISPPQVYGSKRADTTLIGWGSTYGALHEAVDILRKEKISVNLLHLSELWPFPAEVVADILSISKNSYVVENNATGQLARLIRSETGKEVGGKILKFDGRPFTPVQIVEQVKKRGC